MNPKAEQAVNEAIEYLEGKRWNAALDERVTWALGRCRVALAIPEESHRRRLPDERQSITHHFEIGNFDGYLTVGHYDDGAPGEVFVKISKQGATLSGLLDAFAIMFSIALQYGAPLHVITDKLAGMRFDPSGFSKYPGIGYAKSLTDYIARWMVLKYLPPEERPEASPPPLVSEPPPPPVPKVPEVTPPSPKGAVIGCDGPPCDRCGSIMQKLGPGDCWICPNCAATSGSCGG